MYRFDIINHFIKKYNFNRYLEIGVFDGECIRNINCNIKDGVDPGAENGNSKEVNYKMTSDDFFKNNPDKIYDIIFIDGLHHSEQVDIDIENSLKHTIHNGVIVLHDCNPPTYTHAHRPRISTQWNGDVYKSILKFRKCNTEHECFTIDTDWGVSVILKNFNSRNILENVDFDMGIRNWEYFNEKRVQLLNLISTQEFLDKYS